MKCKITTGKSFGGLLRYLIADGRGELIGGNMAAADTKGLTWEFGAIRGQRPDIAKPVWHCSLSLPPGDDLDTDQWQQLADQFRQKMQINDAHQFCLVQHRDREHQHIHLVINRIAPDGAIWYNSREVYRGIAACRELEQQLDFLRDTSAKDNTNRKFYPSHAEQSRADRTGHDPARQRVHDAIRRIIAEAPQPLTPEQFVSALAKQGIEARPNIAQTGRMNGFSFSGPDGEKYTGSKVGVKWAQLSQELDYQPERDNPYLMGLIDRNPAADQPPAAAFDEVEYTKLRAALDDCMREPCSLTEFAERIREVDINVLLRGARDLQHEHYAALARLANESREAWAELRGTRRPRVMRPEDLTFLAVVFALNPVLALLCVVPIIFEKISKTNKLVTAKALSAEIDQVKIELAEVKIRREVLREVQAMSESGKILSTADIGDIANAEAAQAKAAAEIELQAIRAEIAAARQAAAAELTAARAELGDVRAARALAAHQIPEYELKKPLLGSGMLIAEEDLRDLYQRLAAGQIAAEDAAVARAEKKEAERRAREAEEKAAYEKRIAGQAIDDRYEYATRLESIESECREMMAEKAKLEAYLKHIPGAEADFAAWSAQNRNKTQERIADAIDFGPEM